MGNKISKGKMVKHSKKILVMNLPGETADATKIRIESDLTSLPKLRTHWNKLKEKDLKPVEFIEEFTPFFGDFSHLWSLSSPITIDTMGFEECFSILEFASPWKALMWSPEMFDLYEQLPEEVAIYRGAEGPIENVLKGYSWSLDKRFAATFAPNSGGIVVSGLIDRSDILLLGDSEFEVVPRINSIYAIREVEFD